VSTHAGIIKSWNPHNEDNQTTLKNSGVKFTKLNNVGSQNRVEKRHGESVPLISHARKLFVQVEQLPAELLRRLPGMSKHILKARNV
jgi:hypothetical protein